MEEESVCAISIREVKSCWCSWINCAFMATSVKTIDKAFSVLTKMLVRPKCDEGTYVYKGSESINSWLLWDVVLLVVGRSLVDIYNLETYFFC